MFFTDCLPRVQRQYHLCPIEEKPEEEEVKVMIESDPEDVCQAPSSDSGSTRTLTPENEDCPPKEAPPLEDALPDAGRNTLTTAPVVKADQPVDLEAAEDQMSAAPKNAVFVFDSDSSSDSEEDFEPKSLSLVNLNYEF